MRHDAVSRLSSPKLVSLLLTLVAMVVIVGMLPASGLAQDGKVQKLVFASAGFEDSNRFWMVSRPDHLQYDPFLETLLEVDPKTGEYTPRLAEKWTHTADFKEWTFFLRKGVTFHNGWGPFTAKDVVHSHAFMMRPEATASVCRAYIEHEMQQLPQPVRLYYMGPMFRRDRPQKGRYRRQVWTHDGSPLAPPPG